MNGPIRMYKTPQIVHHDVPVALPQCMYKVKNIHDIHVPMNGMVAQSADSSSPQIWDQVKQFLKADQSFPTMANLENRQKKTVQVLGEMRQQIEEIRKQLGTLGKGASTNTTTRNPVANNTVSNVKHHQLLTSNRKVQQLSGSLVIQANPTHPPYGLALLQKWWPNLKFTTHKHSSVASLTDKAKALSEALEQNSKSSNVKVTLIWSDNGRNAADMQLLVSNCLIWGEANILRFFSLHQIPGFNYESEPKPHEIDRLLDISYLIARSNDKSQRAGYLNTLVKSLGSGQWLAGRSQITVADLANYSAIKQVVSSNELSPSLSKWLARCEK